ncbi:hypothetical protein EIP91_000558 [Steccherinum ochraceum]|uniref:NAD(P)-binding protein n=1 Tax=Steccherinum ochraceum TaxID=92696 RepID=A0A4R0RM62_9APHY|nr:hypothetical protein EIP91_000558 [Steccherinum ochraceum]
MSSIPDQFKKGYKPPFQKQNSIPGEQTRLDPQPLNDLTADGRPYKPAAKLEGRNALITGADSGIGRSVALLFALECANVTLHCVQEEYDELQSAIEEIKRKTSARTEIHAIALDLRKEENCRKLVQEHLDKFKTLDALILNHGTQEANTDLPTLSSEQWLNTFDTNIHPLFYICKAAVPSMPPGSTITFNASINMAVGHPELLDYTATKGAIVAFMRALSNQIVGEKGIRCNAIAPGPIWTPLIPATMTDDSIKTFGTSVPMERAGQPIEVATAFVYLASADSSYISGQVIHINGGVVIN